MLAVSEGKGRDTAAVAIAIGQKLQDYDRERFIRQVTVLVGRNRTSPSAISRPAPSSDN